MTSQSLGGAERGGVGWGGGGRGGWHGGASVITDDRKQFQCNTQPLVTKLNHHFWVFIDAKTSFNFLKWCYNS